MNNLILYFGKVNLAIALFYLLYRLLFKRNTFHWLNRFYLLSILIFAWFLPTLGIQQFGNLTSTAHLWTDKEITFLAGEQLEHTQQLTQLYFDSTLLLQVIYLLGVGIFLLRFLLAGNRLIQVFKASSRGLLQGHVVYFSTDSRAPFSAFGKIVLPEHFRQTPEHIAIFMHEKAHVKQLHSFDLLLCELSCIVLWFNPFAFLLKHSLKNLHEYLADKEVLARSADLPEYLKLLANKAIQRNQQAFAHSFNVNLKKRIHMITQNRSRKIRLLPYLFIIPVALMLLQAHAPQATTNNLPVLNPVSSGKISLDFGECKHPITKEAYNHKGIDLMAPAGTDIVAPASGIVVEAGRKGNWGIRIVLKHDETYQTRYAHLQDVTVKAGDTVEKGQIIGHVGNTGISTGPHLHYEVVKNGTRVNPKTYMKQ
jgi:biotin carboxyl carrier protein